MLPNAVQLKPRVTSGGRPKWIPTQADYYFQAQLAKIMNARGITQEELAKMLGLGYQAGHDIVNLHTQPTLSRVIEIAEKLGVPVRAFIPSENWDAVGMDEEANSLWSHLSPEKQKMVLSIMRPLATAHENN